MNQEQQELYQRILEFALDQPQAAFRFSDKLASENRWSSEYTQRVIVEYKRFVLLSVVAGHPVSPSDAVDQVWHQHMLYTESYWGEFCPNVLGRPLHHLPSQGGKDEQRKLQDWYVRTLDSYQHFFDQLPPADIWTPSHLRATQHERFARINLDEHWVIAKRMFGLSPMAMKFSLPKSTLPQSSTQPLQSLLEQPPMGSAVIPATSPIDEVAPRLDPYALAYLAGAESRVAATVITSLVERGHLKHFPEYKALLPAESLAADANQLEQITMQHFARDGRGTLATLSSRLTASLLPIKTQLTALCLLRPIQRYKVLALGAISTLVLLASVVEPRFLWSFILIFIMGPIALFALPSIVKTARGKRLVHEYSQRVPGGSTEHGTATVNSLVWMAAVGGVVALSATEYDFLPGLLQPSVGNRDTGGCGGGGCGGDGGGGCGGCGGGCGGGG